MPSVEEQLAKRNMEVRFITTDAPMLNPTELVFCLFRQQTEKNRPRNYEEMEKAIFKEEFFSSKNKNSTKNKFS